MNAVNPESPPPRTATRAPVDKPVKLQFDDSMDVIEGRCRNVSIGGMFISVDESRPQGSLVRFELVLDDTTSIRGLGEVIWMRPTPAGSTAAGMGLKFRFLEQRDRQMIFKLVSQHIKKRLAHRHPMRDDNVPAADAFVDDSPAPAPAPPRPFQPPLPDPDAPEVGASDSGASTPTAASITTASITTAPGSEDLRKMVPDAPAIAQTEGFEGEPDPSLDESILSMPGDDVLNNLGMPAPTPAAASDLPLPGGQDPDDTPAHPMYPESRPRASSQEAGAFSSGPQRRSRREIPVLPIAAGVLAIGAALLYFFWGSLFGSAPPPVTQAQTAPPPAVEAPAETGGEEGDSETREAPGTATSTAPAGQQSPPTQTPPPAQKPIAKPAVKPTPKPAQTSGAKSFSRIVDIRWRQRTMDRVSIILEGDGPIAENRLRRSRLGGDKPRILLRISGVRKRFDKGEIAVGHNALLGIRTGYHQSNELHIVLDLPSKDIEIKNIRHQANVVELVLESR